MLRLNIFAYVFLCLVLISHAQYDNYDENDVNSNSEEEVRRRFRGLLPEIMASLRTTTSPLFDTGKEETTSSQVTSTHRTDTTTDSTESTSQGLNTTESESMIQDTTTPSFTAEPAPFGERMTDACDKLPTARLIASCKNIAQNTVWATMEFVDFNVDQDDELARAFNFAPSIAGEDTCAVTCPVGVEWTGATRTHERSFSPWTYCTEYDPHRLPQWISNAKCRCRGCMNPETGKEDLNFLSMPLITTIPVLTKDEGVATFDDCKDKTCRESTYQITLGCHCVFPN